VKYGDQPNTASTISLRAVVSASLVEHSTPVRTALGSEVLVSFERLAHQDYRTNNKEADRERNQIDNN